MGFGLGFEKIFATTSIKLPVTAYSVYAEMHSAQSEVFSRVFNGLNTVFDIKKWIFEKFWLPVEAYELSYAEPGKAELTHQLRLLTTDDSIDQRTMATTRAVHGSFVGTPGVHSVGDIGVTRLYVRLKCRKCGALLNDLQTTSCKFKAFSEEEAIAQEDLSDALIHTSTANHLQAALFEARPSKELAEASESGLEERRTPRVSGSEARTRDKLRQLNKSKEKVAVSSQEFATSKEQLQKEGASFAAKSKHGDPKTDPELQGCWHRPDERTHCLFHSRGYEMFERSRTQGGHAELARIYISCEKEPSKKLRLRDQVLAKDGAHMHISH
jgi:hypothetical protein